jgi:hypothetical protein
MKNEKSVTFQQIEEFDWRKSTNNEYIKLCQDYLKEIVTKGNLTQLKEPTEEQLPYLEEYILARDRISIMLKEKPEFAYKVKSFTNIISEDRAEEVLNLLEEQKIERLDSQQGKKLLPSGLTERETQALKCMTRAIMGRSLGPFQLKFVQDFIKYSMGNMDLNKRLDQIKNRPDFIDSNLIYNMYSFTYNTVTLDRFIALIPKFRKLWNRIENNMELTSDYQLTMSEYGIINKVLKIEQFLSELESFGLLTHNKDLIALRDQIIKGKAIAEKISTNIKQETDFKSGDLILYDDSRSFKVLNKIQGLFTKILLLFTKYGHAGKVSKSDNESNTMISHVDPKFKVEDFKPITYLYSDIYRVNVKKLISPEMSNRLKQKYEKDGKDWSQEVDILYQNIEKNAQETIKVNFSNKKNFIDLERFLRAGLADIMPRGHKSHKDRNFYEVADKVLNGFDQNNVTKMLCSEFIAKTTIAALVTLDRALKKELRIDDPNIHVVEMPFDKREKLKRISPDRLVKILHEKGCLEKVERTPTEKKIFKLSELGKGR